MRHDNKEQPNDSSLNSRLIEGGRKRRFIMVAKKTGWMMVRRWFRAI